MAALPAGASRGVCGAAHSSTPTQSRQPAATRHQRYFAATTSRTTVPMTSKANCSQRLFNGPPRPDWPLCVFIFGFLRHHRATGGLAQGSPDSGHPTSQPKQQAQALGCRCRFADLAGSRLDLAQKVIAKAKARPPRISRRLLSRAFHIAPQCVCRHNADTAAFSRFRISINSLIWLVSALGIEPRTP